MNTTTQAIREGLQHAPVEIRKAAVPALDRVEDLLEDLVNLGPQEGTAGRLVERAKALLGRA